MIENNNYNEKEQALKDFLLDIDCLDPLAEWTRKFNLFDILKISKTEIRHSNILSWLLNPNENHGLKDSIIRGFIQYIVSTFSHKDDVFDLLLMDHHDFIIQREWKNIDIIAVSVPEKIVLCIENKIFSKEHNDQLSRYRSIIEENYPDNKKMYILLSPDGFEASEVDYWCSMSYQDVLNIVENACKKVKLLPEAEILINNYIEAIRRYIVGDERLAQICAEIYAKHQKALDLIYENKPDRASDVAVIMRSWASEMTKQGKLEVVLDKCSKRYTRFKTKLMSEILPDTEEARSGWNTKNHYFYEIINMDGNEFFIQLAFSSNNIPDDLMLICKRVNDLYPSKQQKENWQWRIHFRTKKSKIEDEISEEKIYEQLNKKFDEIMAFEKKLKEQLEEKKV